MVNKNNRGIQVNGLFLILTIFSLISLIIASSYASAITGKIGNGRMVLNVEEGQKIERSVRVINDNNVSLNINVFSSGNLSSNVEVFDKDFNLEPGAEKNARFSIYSDDPGSYDTKIHIQFKPNNENESGVGLTSTVILNVYEKGTLPEEKNSIYLDPSYSGNSLGINGLSSNYILGIIAVILVLIVIFLVYYSKKKKGRGEKGGEFDAKNKEFKLGKGNK